MKRRTHLLVSLIVASCLTVAAPTPTAANDGGGDNTAVAINTKDGSSLFTFAFSVKKVMDGVVDQSNIALAYASCEACQTVAIAIQVVLVVGDVTELTPENYAIAINEGCTLCETMASAHQFVFGVGDAPVRFSAEGRQQLADLRKQLQDLRREAEDLTLAEIDARVQEVVTQLRDVLQTELQPSIPTSTTSSSTSSSSSTTSTIGGEETTTTTALATTTTSASTTTSSTTPTTVAP